MPAPRRDRRTLGQLQPPAQRTAAVTRCRSRARARRTTALSCTCHPRRAALAAGAPGEARHGRQRAHLRVELERSLIVLVHEDGVGLVGQVGRLGRNRHLCAWRGGLYRTRSAAQAARAHAQRRGQTRPQNGAYGRALCTPPARAAAKSAPRTPRTRCYPRATAVRRAAAHRSAQPARRGATRAMQRRGTRPDGTRPSGWVARPAAEPPRAALAALTFLAPPGSRANFIRLHSILQLAFDPYNCNPLKYCVREASGLCPSNTFWRGRAAEAEHAGWSGRAARRRPRWTRQRSAR